MKLNNRGFAVSTVLYGLLLVGVLVMALLMNTASFNLLTTKDFVDIVEKDLNDTADAHIGADTTCYFNGNVCEAKRTGYYKINLCGSGYCTEGLIFLVFRQKIYLNKNGSQTEARLDKDIPNSAIMIAGSTPYISGGAGSVSVASADPNSGKKSGKDITYHYSDKYFVNGMFKSGGGSNSMSFIGNADKVEKDDKDPAFNNDIRYITTCGSTWSEIQVIAGGKNIGYGKPVAPELGSMFDPNFEYITNNNLGDSGSNSTPCLTIDIGRDMNNNNEYYKVDQIAVFGSGIENKITLYTEDKQPSTTTGIPMSGKYSGVYFNAYKNY